MTGMIRLGERIKTKKGYAFKSKWFSESGVPVIKATNFTDNSIDVKSAQFIDENVAAQYKDWQLRTNNVVVQTVGSWPSSAASVVGKCIRVPEEASGALLNQNTVILNCADELDENFLYYSLKDKRFGIFIENRARGSANQASITLDDIRDFKLYSYELEHQSRIGKVLRHYDDLIENNKRRIELLEESARQLYKEWFVRFRFPGHEHVKIINGVPEGWAKTTADQVIDILSGGTPKTSVPDYWNGDIGFYTPKDSTSTVYVSNTEKTITPLGLEKCASKLYPKDTLFITARGTVGKLNLAQKPMAMNQSCYALVGKEPVNQIYLFFAMQAGIQQVKSRAVGAVFDAIIKDTFKVIPFVVPHERLIEEFTGYAKPILKQIDFLLTSNEKLTQARDLLLPKLMNGEITV